MLKQRRSERGDTLIEVLFAISVFAMVMVGALSIMNQGTAAAQRSLEITQVRQQVDAQTEALRFIHSAYVNAYTPGITFAASDASPAAQWKKIVDRSVASATPFGNTGTTCPLAPNSFAVNPKSVRVVGLSSSNYIVAPETYARVTYPSASAVRSEGISVQAVRVPATATVNGYVDFHIRACWSTLGMSELMSIGSIVRVYEPR